MLIVGFCERGDSRISENGPSGQIVGEGAVDLLRGELSELFVFGSDADEDEVREGWVVPLFAELDLLVAESVEIVVACELDAWMVRSEGLHEHLALDIAAARVVVVKSRGHFRGGFDEFFRHQDVVEVDAPGLTSPILSRFPWRKMPRPVLPIDDTAEWTPPA